MQNSKKIRIVTEFITLGQFLKFVGLISNGSHAKKFIEKNDIFVDGKLEKRRGRKMYPNSKITIKNICFEIEE